MKLTALLLEKGILQTTTRPAEHASLFFVHKKDGAQRMIVDCRRANQRFRRPPGVSLATPESFSQLECEPGLRLFAAEIDVDNCFHRLRIREDLGRYFSLPPVRAGELGISLSGGGD